MRLPFETRGPSPALVAGLGMVFAAVAAAPAVLEVLGLVTKFDDQAPLATMISTGMLTAVLAYVVLRARTVTRAVGWCVLLATVFGALNVGLAVSFIGFMDEGPITAIKLLLVGCLMGVAVGSPAGLIFGVTFVVPSTVAHAGRNVGSHAAAERTWALVGLWLMVVTTWPLFVLQAFVPLAIPAWVAFGLGAVTFSIGGLRLLSRWYWLHRVRTGRIAGWSIEPREDRPEDHELRPFVHRPETDCWNVLVRHVDGATAYRDRDAVPVALC